MIFLQATEAATGLPDDMVEKMVLALVVFILTIGGNFVIQLVNRNWSQSDKASDKASGASNRELDRVWDALKEIQKTQMDIQKGLLRVELRLEAVEGFAETSKEIARVRGRMLVREEGQ